MEMDRWHGALVNAVHATSFVPPEAWSSLATIRVIMAVAERRAVLEQVFAKPSRLSTDVEMASTKEASQTGAVRRYQNSSARTTPVSAKSQVTQTGMAILLTLTCKTCTDKFYMA